ncbi:MAG TPA: succinate dehydrogenase assembly factor 2 [Dokdonella sp.]
MSDAPSLRRLRWRCRRGTRELDLLLEWWLDERYPHADAARRAAFAELLELQDPELWSRLAGAVAAEPRFAAIVDEIRARRRV